jgi:hypothetical protein
MWTRAVFAWLLIAAVETVHGTFRILFVEPRLGLLRAHQISVATGLLLILGVAWLTIRWIAGGARLKLGTIWRMGALWLVLMLAFEFGLGFALGRTAGDLLADYDLSRGRLMLLGMPVMLVAPWIAARLRGL